MFLLKNNKLSNNQICDRKSPKNNSRKIQAFSLIELSIVILIIGILVAGVTSSSRLIKKMKLITAQNLTNSSPIHSIKNLALWLESSQDNSFNNNEASNNTEITIWYDSNIQSTYKVNAFSPSTASNPKFVDDSINNLPAIRFDGSNDYLRIDSAGIYGSQLTYFVVTKRITMMNAATTFSGLGQGYSYDADNSASLIGFYEFSGTQLAPYRANAVLSINNVHPGNGVPYIASAVFNGTTNIAYLNGVANNIVNSAGNFAISTIYIGTRVYNSAPSPGYYNGDIAELIFFTRALNSEERISIEQYLGKKYGIKFS